MASTMDGKIKVSNTLESRLELLQESVILYIYFKSVGRLEY